MSALQRTLQTIAAQFAQQVIHALRGVSIDDLVEINGARSAVTKSTAPTSKSAAPTSKGAGGRRGRRSVDDIQQTLDRIVFLLGQHEPDGLRAEDIKAALGLDKREMPKPIALGLSAGVLSKTGQRRGTVYTVGSGGPASKAPAAKKTGKRAPKRKKAASGKRAAKKKNRIEARMMTGPEMERSILSFIHDAGAEGATEEEWADSAGSNAASQRAVDVWANLVADETICRVGVRRRGSFIYFLTEDRPAPERIVELRAKHEKKQHA